MSGRRLRMYVRARGACGSEATPAVRSPWGSPAQGAGPHRQRALGARRLLILLVLIVIGHVDVVQVLHTARAAQCQPSESAKGRRGSGARDRPHLIDARLPGCGLLGIAILLNAVDAVRLAIQRVGLALQLLGKSGGTHRKNSGTRERRREPHVDKLRVTPVCSTAGRVCLPRPPPAACWPRRLGGPPPRPASRPRCPFH